MSSVRRSCSASWISGRSPSRGPGPDHVADADVPENAVQLLRRQILESGKCHRPVFAHLIAQNHQPVAAAVQLLEDGLPVRLILQQRPGQLFFHAGIRRVRFLEADRPGIDERLILRLPEIQSVIVDIFLYHRVDQIGNIPVHIDVFPDSGGGNLHQLFRKLQLHQFSPDLAHHIPVILGIHLFIADPTEGDVIHAPDHVIVGAFFIEGSVGYDVRTHHQVELPVRKDFLESPHIVRIAGT